MQKTEALQRDKRCEVNTKTFRKKFTSLRDDPSFVSQTEARKKKSSELGADFNEASTSQTSTSIVRRLVKKSEKLLRQEETMDFLSE